MSFKPFLICHRFHDSFYSIKHSTALNRSGRYQWSRQECGSTVILAAINSQKVLDVLDKSITLAIHARGSITYHLLIHDRNNWTAQTYDEVSRLVQYRWDKQVLEWRKWNGDESVMDAGCGSGLLTKLLTQRVPRGRVYAVDVDSNMIKQAKRNLKDLENVELVQSDIADLHEVEKRSNRNRKLALWSLDYVRLNIIADKP